MISPDTDPFLETETLDNLPQATPLSISCLASLLHQLRHADFSDSHRVSTAKPATNTSSAACVDSLEKSLNSGTPYHFIPLHNGTSPTPPGGEQFYELGNEEAGSHRCWVRLCHSRQASFQFPLQASRSAAGLMKMETDEKAGNNRDR
jgi:hypothetical protein